MSTIMEEKLKAAGVAVPTVKERVWKFVVNNPGCTHSEIHKALSSIPRGSVNSQLYDLVSREVLYSKPDPKRGHRAVRLFTDFTVYPDKARGSVLKRTVAQKPAPAPAPAAAPVPGKLAEDTDLDRMVDNLTLAQARQLWLRLNAFFG